MRQYVWGLRYVDDLIQRKRDTSGTGLDETLYAVTDREFNVVALASTTGAIQQRIVYTPYGEPTFLTAVYNASSNTYDWRHLFQGLRNDEETGLIYNRNRVLHPLLGRFLQRDPLGYPDGLNAYAGYQVMWGGLDPMGLEEFQLPRPNNGRTCIGCHPRRDQDIYDLQELWGSLERQKEPEGDPNCTGKITHFSISAVPGDWFLEMGSFEFSWYGVGAVKVCINVSISVEVDVVCDPCCPVSSVSGRLVAGPIKKACVEIEVPYTAAIGLAVLAGAPIPGTRVIMMIAIAATAVRVSQKLLRTYETLLPIKQAKDSFESTVKSNTAIPNKICRGLK